MTLFVHAYGAYASYTEPPWRQADYHINKLVKALKGEAFKGYARIRGRDGAWRCITSETRPLAYETVAVWGAERLRELDLGPVTLVPIPSSSCTAYGNETCPRAMAEAIQARMPGSVTVGRWLRFAEPQIPSHDGGDRSQARIFAALRCSNQVRATRVILVDDVKTTGAHMLACADLLRQHGVELETAIVAATVVKAQVPDPFVMEPEDLEISPFDDIDW